MRYRYWPLVALLAVTALPTSAQSPSIVLLPDQIDNDAGYNGQDLAQLANGDILVVYVKNGIITSPPGTFPPTGEPAQLILTRSADGGATWSSSDTLRSAIPDGVQSIAQPQIAVLASGRILVSYFYETSAFPNYMAGEEALYSDDNGATWAPHAADGRTVQVLAVSPSASGSLVAVYWRERNRNGDQDFWTATSTDEGATWVNERFLAQTDPICAQDLHVSSDTDWTFIWADCVFGTGGTNTVYRRRTTDGGATWSTSEPLFTAGSAFGTNPTLVVDANGMQSLLHSDGLTMAYRTSSDGGTTWSDAVDWSQGTNASRDFGLTCAAGLDRPLCVFQSLRGSTNHLLHFASIDALVTDADEAPPQAVALRQNTPNPFSETTTIAFELSQPADVTLALYDLLGRQLRLLASGPWPGGRHTVTVAADDLPSGLYTYRLWADGHVATRRLTIAR